MAARCFDGIQLPSDLSRKFLLLKLSLTLPAPANAKLREELTQVAASLDGSYGKGKYCPGGPKEPWFGSDDLEEQMVKLRDPIKLRAVWTGVAHRGSTDARSYARFVDLSNQEARELGFKDTGDLWRAGYDMTPEQFSADLERLWKQAAIHAGKARGSWCGLPCERVGH